MRFLFDIIFHAWLVIFFYSMTIPGLSVFRKLGEVPNTQSIREKLKNEWKEKFQNFSVSSA